MIVKIILILVLIVGSLNSAMYWAYAEELIYGISYGTIREGQHPIYGPFPTNEQIKEDIRTLEKITNNILIHKITRTQIETISVISDSLSPSSNLNLSLYIDTDSNKNKIEIDNTVKILETKGEKIDKVFVGENPLELGLPKSELIDYINHIKNIKPHNVQISTSLSYEAWMDNDNLKIVQAVDFISLYTNPYIDGTDVKKSHDLIFNQYYNLEEKFDKKVVLTGINWPSAGEIRECAVPSNYNQKYFFKEFLNHANQEQLQYFIFEAFDAKWKGNSLESNNALCKDKQISIKNNGNNNEASTRNSGIIRADGKLKIDLDVKSFDSGTRGNRIFDLSANSHNPQFLALSSVSGKTLLVIDHGHYIDIIHPKNEKWILKNEYEQEYDTSIPSKIYELEGISTNNFDVNDFSPNKISIKKLMQKKLSLGSSQDEDIILTINQENKLVNASINFKPDVITTTKIQNIPSQKIMFSILSIVLPVVVLIFLVIFIVMIFTKIWKTKNMS